MKRQQHSSFFQNFSNLDALPDSIDVLIHLRYLDLSCTFIQTLPESLCNLYNIQKFCLKIRGVKREKVAD